MTDEIKVGALHPGWPEEPPAIRTIAMPADANPEGDIFGGWLMSQMDLAGASAAFQIARGRCVTVAVDGMTFLNPVMIGDEISLFARPLRIGTTSITVDVEAWRRRRGEVTAAKVTEGKFTYVAIGPDRKPRPVRP